MKNNQAMFSFKIDGKDFELPKEKVTAKQIIELAKEKGLPEANLPIEDLTLKSGKDLYSGNENVDLSKENVFSLEPKKIYKFKVNGQEMESKVKNLTAKQIIELAKEKGATLPGDEQSNLLVESVGKHQRQFQLEEEVNLSQFCDFLLILNEPTPVA